MHGDLIGGPIRWRMHLSVPPERVFAALDTDEGRAAFWAESSEADGIVETHAGWLNVLFPLKAYVVHGVDLRNGAKDRSWEQGYVDG